MKQQVVYIHGGTSFASQEGFLNWLRTTERISLPTDEKSKRWSSSLAEDFGERYEVFTPTMPNKYNARYIEWKVWFERYLEHLNDGVILVGWSRGANFLAKYLVENNLPIRIKALVLVAPVYSLDLFPREIEEDGKDFEFDVSKLGKLQELTPKIVIAHSKDDFVVPFEHGKAYAEALPDAEFMVFADKNHFLIEEFPELISKIKDL